MRREAAADLGLWLTVAGCALVIVLSLAAVGWRLTGHGPIFPMGEPQEPVTVQTVAPAVTYEAEEVEP